jgi:O-antigen/teichoic acid export membrane protein
MTELPLEVAAETVPARLPKGGRGGARAERRQFILHNIVAAAGTWGAGVLGLVLQAMVSHRFSPSAYGHAFAVFTFFTILTQPAAGFSRMVAWSTSREVATGRTEGLESSSLLRSTNRRLLIAGVIIAAAFVAGAPLLGGFLHVPSSYVILGALGVPFLLSTAPLQASLQGEQRWGAWSGVSIAIAASRVGFVAVGVLMFGIEGVLLGISVAAAVVYVATLFLVRDRLRRGSPRISWRPQRNFLIVAVASTVMVASLMGTDVLLVEHLFSAREGGQFSSVTVTSRALFFAMGSVTSVLFPKVAARHANARRTTSVVAASVALGLAGGLAGLVVFSLGSHVILKSFSGGAYVAGASYIGWYALGMPLLATVVMLSNSLQSLADLRLLWVLSAGTVIKPVLILFFHQSLLMVSVVSDISILAILLALALTYIVQERQMERGRARGRLAAEPGAGDEESWAVMHRPRLSDEAVPEAREGR